MRKASFGLILLSLFMSPLVWAGGGGGGGKADRFDWKKSSIIKVADDFVAAIAGKNYTGAYGMGSDTLRKARTVEAFTADMKKWRFDRPGKVEWTSGNNALPGGNGFKLMGTYTATDGEAYAVYMHFEGDSHVDPKVRNRKWE